MKRDNADLFNEFRKEFDESSLAMPESSPLVVPETKESYADAYPKDNHDREFFKLKHILDGLNPLNLYVTSGTTSIKNIGQPSSNLFGQPISNLWRACPYQQIKIVYIDSMRMIHTLIMDFTSIIRINFTYGWNTEEYVCVKLASAVYLQEFIYSMEELYENSFDDHVHELVGNLVSTREVATRL